MPEPERVHEDVPRSFELGEFEIRPAEGTVARGGSAAHLEPKVMAVLVHLARHRGCVVSKEELLRAVWPDTAVEEIALARSVSELRRVLGDDAKHPRYIETHHRRGYRLLDPGARPGARRASLRRRRGAAVGLLVLAAGAAGLALWRARSPSSGDEQVRAGAAPARPRIAVLPFANLGPAEEEYFSAGMTEELTSRLASVRGLAVISRTSTMQYAGTLKSVPQIAAELGADYVIEGSVRWETGAGGRRRVRITPQLIRASDDTHVWSEVYESDLAEIFALQSKLAGAVIEHVGGVLLARERRGLAAGATGNPDAYRAYLRGLHLAGDPTRVQRDESLRAIGMFERAVALDPEFALAHAELSRSHSFVYHFGYDRSDTRCARAREAALRAVELQPDLARGRLALGYYYYRCLRDYERALAEYALAERSLPNDADLLAAMAYIERRQGRMESARARLEAACTLDPLGALIAGELGLTYSMLRDYPRAERVLEQAISLAPDLQRHYFAKAWTVLLGRGDWPLARSILGRAPGAPAHRPAAELALLAGDHAELLARLSATSERVWIDQVSLAPRVLLEAFAYDAAGDAARARTAYAAALGELDAELARRPDDYRVHMALGLAYAGLGRKEPALRHGRQGAALLPVSKDANGGPFLAADLARIHALVGEPEAALDLIERLLAMPAGHCLSAHILATDPRFAPLRGHPRYRQLLDRNGISRTS